MCIWAIRGCFLIFVLCRSIVIQIFIFVFILWLRLERFDDGVFALAPPQEIDLPAALAAEGEPVGSLADRRRNGPLADGTLDRSNHNKSSHRRLRFRRTSIFGLRRL